ncbi:TonB-dependent receptor [Pseudomaricurvus alcaniphilus]|uniref:TonB-dependent receptor n=1 Tax=Pseudomaricurvus alcaniphilus TaxID=1166482 RepID=UPI00140D2C24|nr:TonB-dependent receptor [Pseudomaricurvus alcaniphilus]NHN38389.1 TonB-dependent receptor [Pseudomaricurvus alcaniphilus]
MTQSARFRKSILSVAICSAIFGHYANGQEAEEKKQQVAPQASGKIQEEVVVYGVSSAIEKSINDKRFSENIADTINAEDIGKSADQNVADALSRVTGVTTQQVDGEGTKISIRGANPQQNVIVMNGVEMSTTDFSQGVDLSAYSSDVISKIVVIKSPSANHHEGALGGIVYMQSPKPLELKEDVRVITLQGRYGELSEKDDYKISGSFSETFFNDKLGMLVTAFDETNSVRRDQFSVDRYVPFTSRIARDPDGNILEDVTGLAANASEYRLYQNDRNRQGVDLALQWDVSDKTTLNLNASYNQQEVKESMHMAVTRLGNVTENMVEGVEPDLGGVHIGPSQWTDPQEDWHTFDPETRTFTKLLNRFNLGDLRQSENHYDNENTIVKLQLAHTFSDDFRMYANLSSSKSERIPVQGVFVGTQNWDNIAPRVLAKTAPGDLEPVGYDCTSGECRLVAGRGFVDLGDIIDTPGQDDVLDNTSTTGFNPDDLGAQHLSFMSRNVTHVEDERADFNVDFHWNVDLPGVRKVQFGYRYNTIDKFVDDQTGSFSSVNEGQVLINPDTGQPIVVFDGLQDLDATLFFEGNLDASDFMDSLGYGRDNVTDGWLTFSAFDVFEQTQGAADTLAFVPDNTQTRSAELDNQAAYVKFDFAFLDERLSGDIGLRYVKTDVQTAGYSGVNFFSDPANLARVFDPFVIRAHSDPSQPACSDIKFYGVNAALENRWSRVDGQGWDTNGTPNDFTDDIQLPDEGNCYYFRTDPNQPENGWWWNWRLSDVSTESRYIYGDRPLDENGEPIVEDRSLRSFGVEGEHTYSMLLPSLNLNYALKDDMMLRFAASKTMSRPQIDSLRPGFRVNETVWGNTQPRAGNTITLFNSTLDPLESKNLDLSFEWYFAESSIASIGLFSKEMTNFEESEQVVTYMDDLRGLGLDPNEPAYDPTNLVKFKDDLDNCMPRRLLTVGWQDDWFNNGGPEELCAQFTTTRIKNGKGASIKGLEMQYVQQYHNLPGLLAGLGLALNYTYQDSQFDQEVSSIDSSVKLPALPVTFTPEHSYNASMFWTWGGHQVRLSYQAQSDVLVDRSWNNGSLWQEGRNTLDLSATYAINDNMSLTFDAVNLTDEETRTYFTSRFLDLGDVDGEGNAVLFDEGNPLDGDGTQGRTISRYKTGPVYRLGFRMNF